MRAAALAALLAAGPAVAQDVDCTTPQTQYELNVCSAADASAADAELNAVWGQAKASADAQGVGARLLAAQRLWIPYRDAACDAETAQYDGGSIQPLVFATCIARLTRDRTRDLREFVGN